MYARHMFAARYFAPRYYPQSKGGTPLPSGANAIDIVNTPPGAFVGRSIIHARLAWWRIRYGLAGAA